jgi:Putative zinc-finger
VKEDIMSHVDDGTLHALVDDALAPDERDAVQAHLASCGECASRFAEATSMARQVLSLLSALDEAPAAPVRIVAPAPTVVPGTKVIPLRTHMITLRRVAMAASVLLVAGVSYQVGRTKESAAEATPAAPSAPKPSALGADRPSVVTSPAENALQYNAMPPARTVPRGGPRAESEALAERDELTLRGGIGASNAASAAGAPQVAAVPTPTVAALPEAAQRSAPAEPALIAQRRDQAAEQRGRAANARMDDAQSQSAPGGRAQQQQTAAAPQSQAPMTQQSPTPMTQQSPVARSAPPPAPASPATVATADTGQLERSAADAPARKASAAADVARSNDVGRSVAKPALIAGYTATDEASQPAIIRRRYVSSAGTPLLLVIVQATTTGKAESGATTRQEYSREFVVHTAANGRSTVRWQRDGRAYELQGALSPDSLMKIAIQLR